MKDPYLEKLKERILCPTCKGSGSAPNGNGVCQTCKGKGTQ